MSNIYYNDFDFYNMKPNSHLHLIEKFATLQQKIDYTCGISCIMMVLGYFGVQVPDEMSLAKRCHSKEYIGTKLKNLIGAVKKLSGFKVVSTYDLKNENGICFPTYEEFKKFAIKSLDNKIPLIVENCVDGGHYRVLIGFDEVNKDDDEQDVLIFADPSDLYDGNRDGYNYTPAQRFYCTWFDDHCLEKDALKQAFLQILPTGNAATLLDKCKTKPLWKRK